MGPGMQPDGKKAVLLFNSKKWACLYSCSAYCYEKNLTL
jgi:hypothetical protein